MKFLSLPVRFSPELLALAVVVLCGRAAVAADKRPNVLFIYTDDK
jgi:hypothetical protein